MIDLHSHILPAMDDGSGSIEESLKLLEMLKEQGVELVAATPHFYATQESPEHFLMRRAAAWESLSAHCQPKPAILLGAEVFYYDGISSSDCLPQLRIEGTELLLLEMPFVPWTRRNINEILSIQEREGFTVVLAHIERYFSMQPFALWEELQQCGVKLQVNADSLLYWRSRAKLLKLMKQGSVHFVASDCHNLNSRPPRLQEAWQLMKRKLPLQVLEHMAVEEQFCRAKEVVE